MSERVEPPAEHRGVRWHWLAWRSEPARLVVWRERPADSGGSFWGMVSALHGSFMTPNDAAEDGYRYLAPCLPPEAGDV